MKKEISVETEKILFKINNLSKLKWRVEKRECEREDVYDLYCDSHGMVICIGSFYSYSALMKGLNLIRMYAQFEKDVVFLKGYLNNRRQKIKDALNTVNALAQTSDYFKQEIDTEDLQLINQIVLERLDELDS